jgi:transglutaminase-like putative cysteine protease
MAFHFQPARMPRQTVLDEQTVIQGPCTWQEGFTPGTHNRQVTLAAQPGTLVIDYRVKVELRPELVKWRRAAAAAGAQARIVSGPAMPYLLASRYCESDKLLSFAGDRFTAIRNPYERARTICDWVREHLQFTPGATDWHTSAIDTFSERRGVCRDYSHLMIALCRASNLPARFVTGMDYGCSFGDTDFHAYVEVLVGRRWFMFDPTGLCPRTGLVRIATGRDAADTAFSTIFGAATMQSMKLDIQAVGANEAQVRAHDRPKYGISSAAVGDLLHPDSMAMGPRPDSARMPPPSPPVKHIPTRFGSTPTHDRA